MNSRANTGNTIAGPLRVGATLLEVLVMVAVLSMVLTAVSVTMATLWREQRGIQDDLTQRAAMDYCSRQFRADAHLAWNAELIEASDGGSLLRLQQPEFRIEYAVERNRIRRTQYQSDNLVHGEEYTLAENANITCKLFDEPVRRISLIIEQRNPLLDGTKSSTPGSSVLIVEQVEATIGLFIEDQP